MSTSGGIWRAVERGAGIQCEIIQLFVKNNMQWFGKPYPADALDRFQTERRARGGLYIFGHAGYLINLAAPPSDNRARSIQSLIQEIELATALGIPFLVLHPGAHLGAGERKGIARVVSGLNEVFRATPRSPVRIALENTAGQGTCLGHQLWHLREIYERVKKPERLAVCLDTAHFFAAGYDIRTRRGWEKTMREAETVVGLREVLAFHLNDSKSDLGSRVDRHDHIGKGKIGCDGFRHMVNDPRLCDLPGCLETPKSDDLHEDIENLKMLRSLVRCSFV